MRNNSRFYIEAMEYIDNLPIEIQDYLYTVAANAARCKKSKKNDFLHIIKLNCPKLNANIAAQVLMDYYIN